MNSLQKDSGMGLEASSQEVFDKQLDSISKPSFVKNYLIVKKNENGVALKQTHVFCAAWEKITGLLGYCNSTDETLIEFATIAFLEQNKTWAKNTDNEKINQLAERAGLRPDRMTQMKLAVGLITAEEADNRKKKQHESLNAIYENIITNKTSDNISQGEEKSFYTLKFYYSHIRELDHFNNTVDFNDIIESIFPKTTTELKKGEEEPTNQNPEQVISPTLQDLPKETEEVLTQPEQPASREKFPSTPPSPISTLIQGLLEPQQMPLKENKGLLTFIESEQQQSERHNVSTSESTSKETDSLSRLEPSITAEQPTQSCQYNYSNWTQESGYRWPSLKRIVKTVAAYFLVQPVGFKPTSEKVANNSQDSFTTSSQVINDWGGVPINDFQEGTASLPLPHPQDLNEHYSWQVDKQLIVPARTTSAVEVFAEGVFGKCRSEPTETDLDFVLRKSLYEFPSDPLTLNAPVDEFAVAPLEMFQKSPETSQTENPILSEELVSIAGDYAELQRLKVELNVLEHLPNDFAFSAELALKLGTLKDEISAAQLQCDQISSEISLGIKKTKNWKKEVSNLHAKILSYSTLLEQFQMAGFKYARGEQHLNELIRFLSERPEEIDNQLLLHIAGDPYGEKTSFEGGSTTRNLRYLLSTLEKRIAVLSDRSICSDEQRIGYCQALFHDSELASHLSLSANLTTFSSLKNQITQAIAIGEALSGSFEDYHQDVVKGVDALNKEGESFFFPIKWPKHALALEMIKDQSNLYTVRIYNTGKGSEVQANCTVETSAKILPFTEITGLTEESVKDSLFHNLLWRLDHTANEKLGPNELYGPILKLLGGTLSVRSYSIEEYIHGQRSGTCSYAVLNAVFSQLLTNTLYPKRFDWEIQFKTIVDFYKKHFNILSNDQVTRNNLQKALSEFNVVTKNLHKKGIIIASEFSFATGKIAGISQAITAAETKYEEMTRNQRLNFNGVSQQIVFPESGTVVAQSLNYQDNWPEGLYPEKIGSSISFIIIPQAFTPSLMAGQLASFIEGHRKLTSHNIGDTMCYYLQTKEFIEALPGVTEIFWDHIPEKDLSNTIELIGDLSFRYFHSVKDFSEKSLVRDLVMPASDFIPALKLISLLDKLIQRIAVSDGIPRYNLYQKLFDEILFSKNPKVLIKDPACIHQLRDLRAYWQLRKPPEANSDDFISFFGAEVAAEYSGLMMSAQEKYRVTTIIPKKNIYGVEVKSFRNWKYQGWARDYLVRNIKKQEDLRKVLLPAEVVDIEVLAMVSLGNKLCKDYFDEVDTILPKILPLDFYTSRDVSKLVEYFLREELTSGIGNEVQHDRFVFSVRSNLDNGFSYLQLGNLNSKKPRACRSRWSGNNYGCVETLPIGHSFANTPPPPQCSH